jgi:PadR family transcriptional regulator PadR
MFLSEEPAYGYQLLVELHEIGLEGADPGTLYRTLHTLEHDGLVESRWAQSELGPRRRVYDITPAGTAALHAEADVMLSHESVLTAFLDRYGRIPAR